MSLNAATIEILLSKGLSGDDLLEVARAMEKRTDPTAAERQRRCRASRVTSRRDFPLDKEIPPTPPKEINPPISPITSDEVIPPVSEKQVLKPEHLAEAYNAMASRTGLPKALKLDGERLRKAKALVRKSSVDDLTEAIAAIERNPWMHGSNDRGWRADFDFLLQPKSFTKLIEGSYDRAQ